MRALPDFVEFNFVAAPDKRQLFPNITDDALHLLNRCLTFDPNLRITAQEVRGGEGFFAGIVLRETIF